MAVERYGLHAGDGVRRHSAAETLIDSLLELGGPWPVIESRRAHWQNSTLQLSGAVAVAADALRGVGEHYFNPFLGIETSNEDSKQVPANGSQAASGPLAVQTQDAFAEADMSHVQVARPASHWVVLGALTLVFCAVEVVVIRRMPDTWFTHMVSLALWSACACGFALFVYLCMEPVSAFDWVTGYTLEWMLSVDNLFLFHVIFQSYAMPRAQIRKALFVGIVGAVALRCVFFFTVFSMLEHLRWIRIPFGLILIWSGIEALRADDEEVNTEDLILVRLIRMCLGSRLASGYDEEGHGFFVRDKKGRLQVSMLLIVVVVLEASDIVFAVDSVSSKVAAVPDRYIAFSSTVLAMFGLRALFFIMSDVIDMFSMMKYGFCIILVFIGVQLVFSHWLHLSSSTVLILILSVFFVSIVASIVMKPRNEKAPALEKAVEDGAPDEPWKCHDTIPI